MAGLTTLTEMPAVFTAGDTLLVSLGGTSYPAPDWTLSFSFRSVGKSAIDFTGAQDGSTVNTLLRVEAGATAAWLPGTYQGEGKATYADGSKVTFWRGTMEVRPDMSQQDVSYDPRSKAEIIRDNLLARLQGKATQDVLNYSVEGVSIGKMTWDQLQSAYSYWNAVVGQEKAVEAAKNGKHAPGFIGVTFQPVGWTNP